MVAELAVVDCCSGGSRGSLTVRAARKQSPRLVALVGGGGGARRDTQVGLGMSSKGEGSKEDAGPDKDITSHCCESQCYQLRDEAD